MKNTLHNQLSCLHSELNPETQFTGMAKAKKENSKPKADIDFEQELWDAANELRGAVAENQYKDYVLSLLFLKHMSERYEMRKEQIFLSNVSH